LASAFAGQPVIGQIFFRHSGICVRQSLVSQKSQRLLG